MRQTVYIVILLAILYLIYINNFGGKQSDAVEKMKQNYATDIEAICQQQKLPAAYFKALVILESSGEKPAGKRFEEHIYQKLLEVRSGDRSHFGRIKHADLKYTPLRKLRKLATSWGPMQLMGYHAKELGVEVEELYGEKALEHAIKWCVKHYGSYLEQSDFRNAFHIHNTGRPFPPSGVPETHDPDYVSKGLNYVQIFENDR